MTTTKTKVNEEHQFPGLLRFRCERELIVALKEVAKQKRMPISLMLRNEAWRIVEETKGKTKDTKIR